MPTLVRLRLNNAEVWMESGEPGGELAVAHDGPDPAASSSREAAITLESSIRAVCGALMASFISMPIDQRPARVTAEFGINLGGESRFYVANLASNGAMIIKAEWELR
ncbi:MAG TPA: CU044_2847 family protein [Acidobacteriaceae bacterium]|nr:CU044_2847 family protein [Acidobacteriaceae bacterium]